MFDLERFFEFFDNQIQSVKLEFVLFGLQVVILIDYFHVFEVARYQLVLIDFSLVFVLVRYFGIVACTL